MNVSPVLDWLRYCEKVRHLRSGTLVCYESTMMAFASWCDDNGECPGSWNDVTSAHVSAFMGRVRARNGVGKASTQERDRAAIEMFFRFMVDRRLVDASPMLMVPKPPVHKRNPKPVSDEAWKSLWRSEMSDDDRLWIGLGGICGLRRREIVSVRPTEVDWRRGMILNLNRKGGDEDILEYEQVAMLLHEGMPQLLPDPHRWLDIVASHSMLRHDMRCLISMDAPTTAHQRRANSFGDDMLPYPGVLNTRLRVVLSRAGLSKTLFTPHALRHTCATNLLRCGLPIEVVADILGHAEIDTTRQYVKTSGRLAEFRGNRGTPTT